MKVREMDAAEAWSHFGELGQRGYLAIDGEEIAGWIGVNSDDQGIYAHSLFCSDESSACAVLVQAVTNLARKLSIPNVRYIVDANNPHMMRFVDKGRAQIQSFIVVHPIFQHSKD